MNKVFLRAAYWFLIGHSVLVFLVFLCDQLLFRFFNESRVPWNFLFLIDIPSSLLALGISGWFIEKTSPWDWLNLGVPNSSFFALTLGFFGGLQWTFIG